MKGCCSKEINIQNNTSVVNYNFLHWYSAISAPYCNMQNFTKLFQILSKVNIPLAVSDF